MTVYKIAMSAPAKYSILSYDLPAELIGRITKLDENKPISVLVINWIFLILLISCLRHWLPSSLFWWAYIPATFIIAGRYGVFLQLIHEGAHNLLSRSKSLNGIFATYFCSLPIGIQFDGYTRGHIRHHAYVNTDKDPRADTEKYRIVDFHDPFLFLLFLKDILGITALSIFFQYDEYDSQSVALADRGFKRKLYKLSQLCLVQLLVLGILFQFSVTDYILLWFVPAVSPHMFLMRIRGIAEHGLAKQMGISNFDDMATGTFYTRSFLTPQNSYRLRSLVYLEKFLIGSLSVHYHHEHHLLPYVPYYHLKELHDAISDQVVKNNPDVYADGYFSAAMRSLRRTPITRLATA